MEKSNKTVKNKWDDFIEKCEILLKIDKLNKQADYSKLLNEVKELYLKLKNPFVPNKIKHKYGSIIDEILKLKEIEIIDIQYVYLDEVNKRSFDDDDIKKQTPFGGKDPITHTEKDQRPFVGPFLINGKGYYLPAKTLKPHQLSWNTLFIFSDKKTALELNGSRFLLEKNKIRIRKLNEHDKNNLLEVMQNKSRIIEGIKKFMNKN